MKVLLAAVNSRFTHSNLALRYLRSSLKNSPHDVMLAEYTINQQLRSVVEIIFREDPDAVVFSVYIWNADFVEKLVRELKILLPRVILVGGGPEISSKIEYWSREDSSFDYLIKGAGETSIRHLADVAFSCAERVIEKKSPHLDELDFPYTDDDIPLLKNRFIYYETSRNCPYRCAYCLSSENDSKVEFRSLDKVFRELDFFSRIDAGTVKFVDRTFNAGRERAREIWRYIAGLKGNTVFHFEIHPELIEDADLEILSLFPKGKIRFEAGIQTLNPDSLQAVNRSMNIERSLENIRKIKKLGTINLHLDLIAGLPKEDFSSFKNSFNSVYHLEPDELQLGFLKVLPGTKIFREAPKYSLKYMAAPPYTVYSTESISYGEILRLEKIEAIVDAVYNTGRFASALQALSGPHGSPFDLFDGLARYYDAHDIDTEIHDWRKIAEVLIGFAGKEDPDVQFLIDSLRWDWIISGHSGYPDILVDPFITSLKEKSIQYLREALEVKDNKVPFDRKNLGKIVFYRSVTGKISNELYVPGSTLAVLKGPQGVTYYSF